MRPGRKSRLVLNVTHLLHPQILTQGAKESMHLANICQLSKNTFISNCPHFQADMLLITKIRGAIGGKERGRLDISLSEKLL